MQRRSFAALTSTVRPTVSRAVVAGSQTQSRGVKTVDFAGHKEQVFERADWPREKLLVCFHFPSKQSKRTKADSGAGVL